MTLVIMCIWLLLFLRTMLIIFEYLKSSFTLLEKVIELEPKLWARLGKPVAVTLWSGDASFHTIQPVLPWLLWLWKKDTRSLDSTVAQKLVETSHLLKKGLAYFVTLMICFLVLFGG